MNDEKSGGWLRSIFPRGQAAQPGPAEPPAPEPLAPGDGPPPPEAGAEVLYFRLQNAQGRILTLPSGETELTAENSLDPALAVVAVVPKAHPHLCLIAAQDVRPLHIAGDTITGIGISARILRSTLRGIVRLKQPLSGLRFLTLEENEAPRFDGPGTTIAAAFQLVPMADDGVTLALRGLAQEFGSAVAQGLRQTEIVGALRDRRLRAELAEPMLRLLARDELDDLSRRLMEEPQTLAMMRRLLPADPWIQTYLPALIAWRATRGPVSADGQFRSPGDDETLILPAAGEAGVPAGLALHALARSHVSPRRGLCILAPARNEGPYLLEWLAYHLSIGFEHVFIYTNDNTDGSDELLARLARHGVITLVHNESGMRISLQEKATAHALTLLPQILDYRWTAVMDLDEYICFDTNAYDSMGDFIGMHEAQPVDALALCWIIFVSKFGEPYRRGLTTERFPWRAHDVNRHVKSIFRTRAFWGSQPHYPYPTLGGTFNFRNEEGAMHHHPGITDRIGAFAAAPTASHAWINHYIFRTAPEALWKLSRGWAWQPSHEAVDRPIMENFVTQAFGDFALSTKLIQDTRIAACATGRAAMLEKLLALPGIAEADETIRFNFELTLKSLATKFLEAPIPAQAAPMLLRFREALQLSQGLPAMPIVQPALSPIV